MKESTNQNLTLINPTLQLTTENYFSKEADQVYMSNSQYKNFITCEAMAMAKLKGEWKEEESDALLLGSYVHAAVEGTLDEFKKSNPRLFTKKGELYAKYEIADRMIETINQDPFIQFVLQGQHEVIITAEFAGAIWKSKLDIYSPEQGRIVDLKTVKSIRDKHWDKKNGYYVSFVEAYGYIRQMALYAEFERIWSGRNEPLESIIVAVSKEDPPDKELIGFDRDRLAYEIEDVKLNMPRILAVKQGLEEPTKCGTCKYCRETKKLSKIVHYADLLV